MYKLSSTLYMLHDNLYIHACTLIAHATNVY